MNEESTAQTMTDASPPPQPPPISSDSESSEPCGANGPTQQQILFINEQLAQLIALFKRKRTRNQWLHFSAMILLSLASATAAILLGVASTGDAQVLKNIALGISAGAGALGTIAAATDFRNLWIRYTVTSNELKAIQADFHYMQRGKRPLSDWDVDRTRERIERALATTNEQWVMLYEKQGKK